MAPQKFVGTPGTNRAPEIPEIRCDRVLSLTSGYLKTSQNPWTLARNFMPRYSSFSANLIQPTGAFYLRDSQVFLNRRNRCHINFFANYLSFWPFGRWPLAPLRRAKKVICKKVDVATISPIKKNLAVAQIKCTCGRSYFC